MEPNLPLLCWCEKGKWAGPCEARNGCCAEKPSPVVEEPSCLLHAFCPMDKFVHGCSWCSDLFGAEVVDQAQKCAGGASRGEVVGCERVQNGKELFSWCGELGLGGVFLEAKNVVDCTRSDKDLWEKFTCAWSMHPYVAVVNVDASVDCGGWCC